MQYGASYICKYEGDDPMRSRLWCNVRAKSKHVSSSSSKRDDKMARCAGGESQHDDNERKEESAYENAAGNLKAHRASNGGGTKPMRREVKAHHRE